MGGKKNGGAYDLSLVMFPWQLIYVRCFRPDFAKKNE